MSKTIIFCADGTWNGPGKDAVDNPDAHFTNVYKLFLNLAGADAPETTRLSNEQERALSGGDGAPVQIAKYLHGVGDSNNLLVRLLGGTFGAGLIARIVRGYTFISRNYKAGDRIVLIGFSRGAYTARALAGLIAAKGLMDAGALGLTDANKALAYRKGSAVWYSYRRAAIESKDRSLLGKFEEVIADLPAFLSNDGTLPPLIPAPIAAVAVWDTVGSLGVPAYVNDDLGDARRVDLFRFADTKLSPVVTRAFQALALDEQRADFTPTLWDADPRIMQRLFAGAHADVGGGYPTTGNESGLSDGAYDWMVGQLGRLKLDGLNLIQILVSPAIATHPDPLGPAHRPWLVAPWTLAPIDIRIFRGDIGIDESIPAREGQSVQPDAAQTATAVYAPTNLPMPPAGS